MVSDVSIIQGTGKHLEVNLRSSKTDQRRNSQKIIIDESSFSHLCPVKAMVEYLDARPSIQGPLFIHFGGNPLTSYQFSYILKQGIKIIGFSPAFFSPHSFRIGAATAAAMAGASVDDIKQLGRWKSSAFNSYIRPHLLIEASRIFL